MIQFNNHVKTLLNTTSMGLNKEIINKFRKSRKQLGMTQLDVAEKANIEVNYYAMIERGEKNPSYETLKELMKILKIKSVKIEV